jgi:hypothetical protein
MTTTTTATPAHRYLELRTRFYVSRDAAAGASIDWDAADESAAIADAAYGTPDQFDEVDLDEQARVAAAGHPLTTR